MSGMKINSNGNCNETVIETFIATLRHDKGTARLKIVSLSGEQGAINQITATEGCPERAIIKLKKINSKKIR